MSKGKKIYFGILLLVTLLVSTLYFSYAYFTSLNEEHGKLNIVAGTLDYKIESDDLENHQITVGANITKQITINLTSLNDIDSKYELYYFLGEQNDNIEIGYSKDTKDPVLGTIESKTTKEITIIIINNSSTDITVTFDVIGGLSTNELVLSLGNSLNQQINLLYQEDGLNGTDPVLTDNLVPIIISEDGTVTKASISEEWYNYEEKEWANAIVLKDTTITYNVGDTIPEDNIESYFVWIPKYSYQLWDLGDYSSLTSIDSTKPHVIPIKFGTTNTSDSVTGECTTPGVSGESGNCQVGDYMTHPAFLAFDSTGFWAGKFETGYDGATSASTANVNSSDSSKIIIKPNVYSWRYVTLGNMFKASYDYLREDESHMMKNTEWGAIAYLQHSTCGSSTSVRINNNGGGFITGYASTEEPTIGYNRGTSTSGNRVESTTPGTDGTYTVNYLNSASGVASTTGNKTGIYDMSGCARESVAGYTTKASSVGGSSGIKSIYSDFFTNSDWEKYYDKYSSDVSTGYNNRILGDATGEMGPFQDQTYVDAGSQPKSSWYGDVNFTITSSAPWVLRGYDWRFGIGAGIFTASASYGDADSLNSFRIVLTP